MKKFCVSLLLLAGIPYSLQAASGPLTLINQPALGYSSAPVVNLQSYGGPQISAKDISAEIVFASATISSSTFTDGTQSTANITVNSNNILAAASVDHITVPTSVLATAATAQVTISSCVPNSIIYVNGNALTNGIQWQCGVNTTTAAYNLAAAMNTYIGAIVSTNVANVIYSTSVALGAIGNTYTITSSSMPAYSTTTFSNGGAAPLYGQTITFNGTVGQYGLGWSDASGTSTGTANSIMNWLNSFQVVTATASGSVVYATATVAGLAGNSFTLSASTTNLTVASANFTGGQDNGNVTINGQKFSAGVNFSTGTTAVTAASLALALNSNLTAGVTAQAVSNVVYATSTAVGKSANYALASSTQAALTLSGPETTTAGAGTGVMTGGTNSSYTKGSATINIPGQQFSTGMQVVLSTQSASNPAISPLVIGTTYYAIVVDPNDVQLALTSTGAIAGAGIVITSSITQTTTYTWGLTPDAWTQGAAAAQWQVSNDNSNWGNFTSTLYNVSIASNTFTAVSTGTVVMQDLGQVDYQYMRYNITAPTQGNLNIQVLLNAKD